MIGLLQRRRAAIAAVALCAGCGSDVAHVELVVVRHPDGCGQVPNADAFTITALGDSGEVQINVSPGDPVFVDQFPGDTHQLALGVRGGANESIGKTAPFSFDDVPATIPISLAPLEGTCALGLLARARRRPQVIAAGEGAIVVGGSRLDAGELEPVVEIEYFDPRTNGFTVVQDDPPGVRAGLRGGALVALPDGRIVYIAGLEGDYGIYDPATRTFPEFTSRLPEPQAFAGVVAIDDHRVAIAGGCRVLPADHDRACAPGETLARVLVLDVDENTVTDLPDLLVPRAHGNASVQMLGGAPVIAVAGGVDAAGAPIGSVELVPLTGTVETIASPIGVGAPLDAGGVLVGFAPPGAPPDDLAGIAVPGVAITRAAGAPPARADAVLVALEDGTVAALGGVDAGGAAAPPLLFRPLQRGWREVPAAAPPVLREHAVARLADGSVLIVGGTDAGGTVDSAAAWRFRPSLIGPYTATASITPAVASDVLQLSVLDPELAAQEGSFYRLTSQAGADNLALVSGPRLREGVLTASLQIVDTGGFTLIARATSPIDRIEVVVMPTTEARVDRIAGGTRSAICTGGLIPILAGTAGVAITLTIDGDVLALQRDGEGPDIERCDVGSGAPGLWGIAAVGDGTQIDLDTITVQR
jgi:hypothetical protein